MLAERGVNVDHTTIYRWVQALGSRNPEVIGSHPTTKRFYRDIQVKHAAEFFMR